MSGTVTEPVGLPGVMTLEPLPLTTAPGGRSAAGGQVRREIAPGVPGIHAGCPKTGWDEGGVFADVLILSGAAVRRMNYLHRSGFAIVRTIRSFNGIF